MPMQVWRHHQVNRGIESRLLAPVGYRGCRGESETFLTMVVRIRGEPSLQTP
jgi:hypothetical protein